MQRDYILRMIEQFGQFAIALRKRITGGAAGSSEVADRLQDVARHAGLDLMLARMADVDTVTALIAPGGEVEPARCWMCAETLYLDGLDAELSGEVEHARSSLRKAKALFSLVAPMGAFLVGFPEARERLAEIEERLAGLGGSSDADGGRSGRPRRRSARRNGAGVSPSSAQSRAGSVERPSSSPERLSRSPHVGRHDP